MAELDTTPDINLELLRSRSEVNRIQEALIVEEPVQRNVSMSLRDKRLGTITKM
jgi:hypothetical protein